jgi:elongation factor 2
MPDNAHPAPSWGFSLRTFAKLLAPKWKVSVAQAMQYLWGDHYYDPEARRWVETNTSVSGKPLKRYVCSLANTVHFKKERILLSGSSDGTRRGFIQFALEPVMLIFKLAMADNLAELEPKLSALGIVLKGPERELKGKELTQVPFFFFFF